MFQWRNSKNLFLGTKCLGVLGLSQLLCSCAEDSGEQRNEDESKKVNDFFERVYTERVHRFPEWMTEQGIRDADNRWSDQSEANSLRERKIGDEELAWLKSEVDFERLDTKTKLSYRIAIQNYEKGRNNFKYRHYNYPINQMFGRHTGIPSFLINMHTVSSEKDAENYVERLQTVDYVFDQLIDNLKIREKVGVVPPKFVFPRVIESCGNIVMGRPFDESDDDSALLEDFKKKVEALELPEERKEELVAEASAALLEVLKPSYQKLIAFLKAQEEKATTDDGVWKFVDGAAFYESALERTTTTELTADEIHEIGLREVDRIHSEIGQIMEQVGFKGDLQAFFEFMRTDEQFYYPNTDEGKEAYLERAVAVIDDMKGRLDTLFLSKPEADLVVKRVEAFREESAGKAFYSRPAPDGSRPGIYYANLFNTKNMPKYELEALAYHEGIPGHHMQLAITQQLGDLPKFRRYGGYTAYIEGWGLYCEYLPKEIGLYEDPYSDYGRLAMELWRACRLVVDTGIHAKKWTREEGISYYQRNTSNSERECVRMVERHIVMPSQATAYKIGMLKILELREKAKESMGADFDIREFHDVVLSNGSVPLSILEELIDGYIASK